MAIKKVEIRPEGDNAYVDVVYPKTSADQVVANDGKTLEDKVKDLGGYATASGTNTYTATVTGVATLTEGMSVKIKFANANTGASTLNLNGLGAKSIVKSNGSALASGAIKAGQICNLVYTGSVFQLLGEGGEYGTATAGDVISGKTIGTDNGLVTGTLAFSGTAVVGNVLAGTTFYSTNPTSKLTGTMVNRGTVISTITKQNGSYTIPEGYHNGTGKVIATFANLSASNIKKGVVIGGVTGTYGYTFYIDTFTSSGSWVAPAGVTSVTVWLMPGGDGGYSGTSAYGLDGTNSVGGAGGSSATVWSGGMTVSPGASYPVIVGAGGNGGAQSSTEVSNAGAVGGTSSVGTTTKTGGGGAVGGAGGVYNNATSPKTGSSLAVGWTNVAGSPSIMYGGAGGGGVIPLGTAIAGATSPGGGNGGKGAISSSWISGSVGATATSKGSGGGGGGAGQHRIYGCPGEYQGTYGMAGGKGAPGIVYIGYYKLG